ncbi:hypothetical protein WA158_000970 [Blastocystis sp. Blastoise]
MGNDASKSSQIEALNQNVTAMLRLLKDQLGVSQTNYVGIMETAKKIAYDNTHGQLAIANSTGDIQIIRENFNQTYKDERFKGGISYFDFTADGDSIVVVFVSNEVSVLDIKEWKFYTILDAYWTKNEIVCVYVTKFYNTDYMWFGLSNGYIRILNIKTKKLITYSIQPKELGIKGFEETLKWVFPCDFSPSVVLIGYKNAGHYLYDIYSHKVLLNFTKPKNAPMSAVCPLPYSPFFLVAYEDHLYIHSYLTSAPMSLDNTTPVFKKKGIIIDNIYVIPSSQPGLYTYLISSLPKDKFKSEPSYFIGQLDVNIPWKSMCACGTIPVEYKIPRQLQLLNIYTSIGLNDFQTNSVYPCIFYLEGDPLKSMPPYIYLLKDTLNSHGNEQNEETYSIKPCIDLFSYGYPSMSEHILTTIYTFYNTKHEPENTYVFNCYKEGLLRVYQRVYGEFRPFRFITSIDIHEVCSPSSTVITSLSCISVGPSLFFSITLYTGEILIYMWDQVSQPTCIYISTDHVSAPLSTYLTSQYLYFVDTFGSISYHPYLSKNEPQEIDVGVETTSSIYPTSVSIYRERYIIIGYNNGGLIIYDLKLNTSIYKKLEFKDQDKYYLYAKSFILVRNESQVVTDRYNDYIEAPEGYDNFDLTSIFVVSDSCMVRHKIDTDRDPRIIEFGAEIASMRPVHIQNTTYILMIVFHDMTLCIYDVRDRCFAYRDRIPIDKRIQTYKSLYSILPEDEQENDSLTENIRGDLMENGYRLYTDLYGYIYIFVATGEVFIYSLFKEEMKPNIPLSSLTSPSLQAMRLQYLLRYITCYKELFRIHYSSFRKGSYEQTLFASLFKYIYLIPSEVPPKSPTNRHTNPEDTLAKESMKQIIDIEKNIKEIMIELEKASIETYDPMVRAEREAALLTQQKVLERQKQENEEKVVGDQQWSRMQNKIQKGKELLAERKEKLDKAVDKSEQLQASSSEFAEMARQLEKKAETESKFFGFF